MCGFLCWFAHRSLCDKGMIFKLEGGSLFAENGIDDVLLGLGENDVYIMDTLG